MRSFKTTRLVRALSIYDALAGTVGVLTTTVMTPMNLQATAFPNLAHGREDRTAKGGVCVSIPHFPHLRA